MSKGAGVYGTITDDQVKTGTGKTWAEWVAILGAWDGNRNSFVAITNYLTHKYKLTQTWAQVIAVYYRWRGYLYQL